MTHPTPTHPTKPDQTILDYIALQDYEAFVLECDDDPQEAWQILDVIQERLAYPVKLSSE